MNADFEKKTGTFISFDGTPIYYEVRGTGKPVVMCYGLACLINHWIQQIKYFSHDYQTIVFDYRGHHLSGIPENHDNLTIDAICQDIKGLLDHLHIKEASFWGHSLGVQLLLRYYDMFPETVNNLIFINGFAENPIKGMFGVDTVATVFRLFKKGYRSFPQTLGGFWRAGVTNPLAIPLSALAGGFNLRLTSMKDIEVYARGVAAMDLDIFMTLFEQMMNYDGTPVLDRINKPVLIISGASDGVTPISYQEKMHRRIRGSQFLVVPYGSHCTQLDLPDFVNLRIDKFLHDLGYTNRPKRGEGASLRPSKSRRPAADST
jgi:pimeloyl-ACP methyl ester carboxylesterase